MLVTLTGRKIGYVYKLISPVFLNQLKERCWWRKGKGLSSWNGGVYRIVVLSTQLKPENLWCSKAAIGTFPRCIPSIIHLHKALCCCIFWLSASILLWFLQFMLLYKKVFSHLVENPDDGFKQTLHQGNF